MKISVITCTYNSGAFLGENIKSVASQTYQDFEHIFIDAFSTDGTLEMIKKYQQEFPDRVKIFQIEPRGISNAMNEGIKKASGDFLIHLHSDDSFFDNRVLEDVTNFLEGKKIDWLYGKINVVNEQRLRLGIFPLKKIFQQTSNSLCGKYLLKFYNYIPHQAVFIKKKVFEEYGYFDETVTSAMDPDMWLRIKNKTSWCFYNRIISNYMVRVGAQSSDPRKENENRENYKRIRGKYLNTFELLIASAISRIIAGRKKDCS